METEKAHLLSPLSSCFTWPTSAVYSPVMPVPPSSAGLSMVPGLCSVPRGGLPPSPALTVLDCTLVFCLIINLLNHMITFSSDKTFYHKPQSRC